MTSLARLEALMARLRDPSGGCPWDRAQDFDSIAPYTIEEAYEVADAIARHDMADLRAELGDLLFQVVFHARMAEEAGAFDLGDVVQGICDKMERRHPHVFGTRAQIAAGAGPDDWERHKARERTQKAGGDDKTGVLDSIAVALPALVRAQKLQQRAGTVGFDWPDAAPVFAKLDEEIGELKAALESPDHARHVEEEMGDILFACANLARKLGLDAQSALRFANAKFERRFGAIEAHMRRRAKPMQGASLEELEACWEAAKAEEHEKRLT